MNSISFVCIKMYLVFIFEWYCYWAYNSTIDWKLFSFIVLMMPFHFLLASIISYWKFSYHFIISYLKGICNHFFWVLLRFFSCLLVHQFLSWYAYLSFYLYLSWMRFAAPSEIWDIRFNVSFRFFKLYLILLHPSLTSIFLGFQLPLF